MVTLRRGKRPLENCERTTIPFLRPHVPKVPIDVQGSVVFAARDPIQLFCELTACWLPREGVDVEVIVYEV